MYIKPEIIICKVYSTPLMVTSCTCRGHCPCDENSDPHNNKCHCSNRYIIHEEEDNLFE